MLTKKDLQELRTTEEQKIINNYQHSYSEIEEFFNTEQIQIILEFYPIFELNNKEKEMIVESLTDKETDLIRIYEKTILRMEEELGIIKSHTIRLETIL